MRIMYSKQLVVIFGFFVYANGANILFLNILPAPSHHFWSRAILNALAENGHNITALSPDIDELPPAAVHYILIDKMYEKSHEDLVTGVLKATKEKNPFMERKMFFNERAEFCSDALNSSATTKLLSYPNDFKFDLVLYDYTIGPCFLPFLHKFRYPPMIGLTAYGNPSFSPGVFGGHQYYSYVSNNLLRVNGNNMSFWDRLMNFALHTEDLYLHQNLLLPATDILAKKYFGPGIPPTGELERRMLLALVNTNPVMDYLAPLPENVIPVGGLHIKDPKPLSKDLEEFMNLSKKGVVLFSLGSHFRSELMPVEKQKMFIDAFSQLPDYHFLWKFESNLSGSELPKNVQIRSWLPLSDALAHPKTKLMLFHGGLLTTQETIWRGVPIVIMPLGLDQHQNLVKTRRLGMAEGINYINLNTADIKSTLLKVIGNTNYKINAKQVSKQYRDQKEKPLDRAVWWIEWVLRNDVEYLRSPVLRLGYFVGNSFDILAFIFFIVFLLLCFLIVIFFTFFYLIKKVWTVIKSKVLSTVKVKSN